MELDFKTVRALSSPTRINILNEALENESTPTDLSEKTGKSKSTVSSHLEKLKEAGLLEKESEEGRRRVVYRPTKKTKAIVEGRSRKVKFSIMSTATTAWIGLGLTLSAANGLKSSAAGTYESAGDAGVNSLGAETAQNAAEKGLTGNPENVLLFTGIGFLSIAVGGLLYGLLMSRINPR